jgi:chromosome segregation ATPase
LIADECGSASWAAVAADAQKYKDECDRLRQRVIELEYSAATANNNNRRRRINDDEMNDSGIVESILLPPPVVTSPIIIGDCILATCVDTRNRLRDENTDLVRRVNDQNRHIVELETDIANLQTQMNDYDNIRQQLTNKVAECEACALTIERMQTEKSTLDKAIDYLEQRCALLNHTLMDEGIIVGTDPITTGRVCVDARSALIGRSKTVQTDLTSESLSTHEQEFHSLHDKLQRIEQEFSCQRSDLRSRFAEIQANLELKTNLVQSLSAQLQAISHEHESAAERVEAERQELNNRIAQLTAVAQRVPLLDAELQRAIADRAELESRQHRERHSFHDAMETSLNETLKQHTDQSQYWQAKLASVERQHSADRAELTKLRKVHNDTKIRLNLEKVQVEQQLQACIDQVAVLTNKVYGCIINYSNICKCFRCIVQ